MAKRYKAGAMGLLFAAAIGTSLLKADVLESIALNPVEHGEARVEFACEHCGAGALRLVAVVDKTVRVECLSCGKESIFERRAEPTPMAKSPTESLPS